MKKTFIMAAIILTIFFEQVCSAHNDSANIFRNILLKYKLNKDFKLVDLRSCDYNNNWIKDDSVEPNKEVISYKLDTDIYQLKVRTNAKTNHIIEFTYSEDMVIYSSDKGKANGLEWSHEKFASYLPVVEEIYGKAGNIGKVSPSSPKDSPQFATLYYKGQFMYRLGSSQVAYDKMFFSVKVLE